MGSDGGPSPDGGGSGTALFDASADVGDAASGGILSLHHETTEELFGLASLGGVGAGYRPAFAPRAGLFNQGNRSIARHTMSKEQCLQGLRGITLQTEDQRARCGADYMVPVWKGKDPAKAAFCIDVFEFPNQPCELPMVWGAPSAAERICRSMGKRLCSQEEWNMACAGDPAGGRDRVYAYGDTLDLSVCHTQRGHDVGPDGKNFLCNARAAETTWRTCNTDTEPAGSFPQCRSRFGVFDQHGNVAEMMTRSSGGTLYTQLKGSAFFYVDVARSHDRPHPKEAPRDTYPDHCAFDPRWHVEVLSRALHSNYHLGFRCCKSLP